jgi:hypothetical protein
MSKVSTIVINYIANTNISAASEIPKINCLPERTESNKIFHNK